MKIHVDMPIRDLLDYSRRLRDFGRNGEADSLEDKLVDEAEIAFQQANNFQGQVFNLQKEVEDLEWKYKMLLPLGYQSFPTIQHAVQATFPNSEFTGDKALVAETNGVFWWADCDMKDLDTGEVSSYSVVGQILGHPNPYIVIKWSYANERDEDESVRPEDSE